jgi:hypothetical protein
VNRAAAERKVRDSDLITSEKAVMLCLLSRSNNHDCIVPTWRTPTESQLAADASVSLSRLKDLLRHLARHRWLAVKSGRGRPRLDPKADTKSRKNSYHCLPAEPLPCGPDCPGIDRKRTQKKGAPAHPMTQKKGAPAHPEKGAPMSEFSQVSPENAPRESPRGMGAGGTAAALCAVCHIPMHPAVAAGGFRTHPCCDPTEVRRLP